MFRFAYPYAFLLVVLIVPVVYLALRRRRERSDGYSSLEPLLNAGLEASAWKRYGRPVLRAAVQSTRDERAYESAMLRTLGASRRVVLAGVATEFAALGVLAGLLAAIGATAGGWFLATELFNLDYRLDPTVWAVGIALGLLIVGGAGTLAARSVVNQPPITTLRA